MDIDDDGDLDFFVVESSSDIIKFFENVGDNTNAVFEERTGAANPFDGIVSGAGIVTPIPAFADIDNDGDFDAFVGNYNGTVKFFENTGDASSAAFFQQTGTDNPLLITPAGCCATWYAAPALADLDADGDFDAIIGVGYQDLRFFENTGDNTNPAFIERTGASNPFDGVPVQVSGYYYMPSPAFVDIDGDGDQDLFLGETFGSTLFYRNTGTSVSPAFVIQTGTDNPLDGVDVGSEPQLDFQDMDNDGDFDAFIGEGSGIVNYFRNTGDNTTPNLQIQIGNSNPLGGLVMFDGLAQAFADLDGDNDFDLLMGLGNGGFPHSGNYFENQGDNTNPLFARQTGTANPFSGISFD